MIERIAKVQDITAAPYGREHPDTTVMLWLKQKANKIFVDLPGALLTFFKQAPFVVSSQGTDLKIYVQDIVKSDTVHVMSGDIELVGVKRENVSIAHILLPDDEGFITCRETKRVLKLSTTLLRNRVICFDKDEFIEVHYTTADVSTTFPIPASHHYNMKIGKESLKTSIRFRRSKISLEKYLKQTHESLTLDPALDGIAKQFEKLNRDDEDVQDIVENADMPPIEIVTLMVNTGLAVLLKKRKADHRSVCQKTYGPFSVMLTEIVLAIKHVYEKYYHLKSDSRDLCDLVLQRMIAAHTGKNVESDPFTRRPRSDISDIAHEASFTTLVHRNINVISRKTDIRLQAQNDTPFFYAGDTNDVNPHDRAYLAKGTFFSKYVPLHLIEKLLPDSSGDTPLKLNGTVVRHYSCAHAKMAEYLEMKKREICTPQDFEQVMSVSVIIGDDDVDMQTDHDRLLFPMFGMKTQECTSWYDCLKTGTVIYVSQQQKFEWRPLAFETILSHRASKLSIFNHSQRAHYSYRQAENSAQPFYYNGSTSKHGVCSDLVPPVLAIDTYNIAGGPFWGFYTHLQVTTAGGANHEDSALVGSDVVQSPTVAFFDKHLMAKCGNKKQIIKVGEDLEGHMSHISGYIIRRDTKALTVRTAVKIEAGDKFGALCQKFTITGSGKTMILQDSGCNYFCIHPASMATRLSPAMLTDAYRIKLALQQGIDAFYCKFHHVTSVMERNVTPEQLQEDSKDVVLQEPAFDEYTGKYLGMTESLPIYLFYTAEKCPSSVCAGGTVHGNYIYKDKPVTAERLLTYLHDVDNTVTDGEQLSSIEVCSACYSIPCGCGRLAPMESMYTTERMKRLIGAVVQHRQVKITEVGAKREHQLERGEPLHFCQKVSGARPCNLDVMRMATTSSYCGENIKRDIMQLSITRSEEYKGQEYILWDGKTELLNFVMYVARKRTKVPRLSITGFGEVHNARNEVPYKNATDPWINDHWTLSQLATTLKHIPLYHTTRRGPQTFSIKTDAPFVKGSDIKANSSKRSTSLGKMMARLTPSNDITSSTAIFAPNPQQEVILHGHIEDINMEMDGVTPLPVARHFRSAVPTGDIEECCDLWKHKKICTSCGWCVEIAKRKGKTISLEQTGVRGVIARTDEPNQRAADILVQARCDAVNLL